jgi:hypothetical protein
MISGVSCSYFTTKVIVAQMSKSVIDYWSAFFYIALPLIVGCYHNNLSPVFPQLGHISDEHVAVAVLIMVVGQYFYYVYGVVQDLAKHLDIFVFKLGKRSTSKID